MSMLEVLQYLSRYEGKMFTKAQLCAALGANHGTLDDDLVNIRRHWIYKAYLRSYRKDERFGTPTYFYVRRGTRRALFARQSPA